MSGQQPPPPNGPGGAGGPYGGQPPAGGPYGGQQPPAYPQQPPQPYAEQQPAWGQQPPPAPWGPHPPQPQPPRQRPAHPHPGPRSYPLVQRTWDYHWWKPAVGILVLLVGGMIVVPIVLLPILFVGVALQGGDGDLAGRLADAATLEAVTPASMLYLNLSLAALTLVAMALTRWIHGLRPRWLSSVRPGIRWRFLAACFGISVIAMASSLLVGALLPTDPNDLGGEANEMTGALVALAVVILLTTPLQAIGEEYAFRGYLMQATGALTRSRVAAVLITALVFALAHGAQNFPLFFDRFAFGLMAGLTVVLIGGLEAGIALHVLNNIVAFGLAIVFGDVQSALTVSEVSWWQLPATLVQNGVYLVLVLLVARRMGLRSTTSPPATQEAVAA